MMIRHGGKIQSQLSRSLALSFSRSNLQRERRMTRIWTMNVDTVMIFLRIFALPVSRRLQDCLAFARNSKCVMVLPVFSEVTTSS